VKYHKDETRGLNLLNNAVQEPDKDCPDALYYLALRHLHGNPTSSKHHISLKKFIHKSSASSAPDTASSQSTAYHLLRNAARLGHSQSMLRLGLAYRSGFLSSVFPAWYSSGSAQAVVSSHAPKLEIGSDVSLALHYLQLASRRGMPEADYEVANSIVWGVGTWPALATAIPPINSEKPQQPAVEDENITKAKLYAPQALTHSRLAAIAGIPDSYALVGIVYEIGVDGWVERSPSEALRYYLKGASKGDEFARKKSDMVRSNLLDNRLLWQENPASPRKNMDK